MASTTELELTAVGRRPSASSNKITKGIRPISANRPDQRPQDGLPTNDTTDSAVADASAQPEYPTGAKLYVIMLVLSAILVVASLDINIVATAVPAITDHFHTVADVGWYQSAYRLSWCSFQFMFGTSYKLFSVKRVFLLANVISIIGSLLCAAANSSAMLIVGRAVGGVASAGIFSGYFAILIQFLPLHRRPMALGLMSGLEGTAILAAPLVGGALTQSLGWRWCFWINLPIGAVTLFLTMWCLYDIPKPAAIVEMTLKQKLSQLDLVSNLVFLPSLTSLFLALSWAGTKYSWSDGRVIGCLVAFAMLLGVFLYNQYRRGDAAALPFRVMKNRTVVAGLIFVMCSASAGNVFEYYMPTYFQVVRGYSPAKSGYMMVPKIIGGTVGAIVLGVGTSTFGYYGPFMLFSSVVMPIAAGLITTFKIDMSVAQLITYLALSGFAYGVGFSGPQSAVQTVLPTDDVLLGSSIMLFSQCFGPAVAVAVAQVLFTNQLSTNLSDLKLGLNGTDIYNTGLTQLVMNVPAERIKDVLGQVDKSLVHTWYLVVGLACMTIIGSLTIEWRSVKAKRD